MENVNKKSLPENVNHIIIDSGNLLTLEVLKRKASILPTEEIVEGMALVLNQWQHNGNLKVDKNIAFISNANNGSNTTSLNNERQSIRITVKVFTFDCNDCDSLTNAVDIVLCELNIKNIDSLILSLPVSSSKLTLEQMKPFWRCAEEIVSNGKVSQLGISDLDTTQLIGLYEWAESWKPTTNHVNLEACCVIPPDMSAYAKQKNIQLLTHNDPKDFIPEERLHSILKDIVNDSNSWKRNWIARYSIIVAGKGIIQNKGYILSTKRSQN